MIALHHNPEGDTQPMLSLNDLFVYADIDDVYDDPEDGVVELAFTLRSNKQTYQAWGNDLNEALVEAREVIAREITLTDLREQGLTDEDIARLADSHFGSGDEADSWDRGYEAGIADAARTTIAAREAIASVRPAAAAAAEPFSGVPRDVNGALDKHPLFSVVYAPIALLQHE